MLIQSAILSNVVKMETSNVCCILNSVLLQIRPLGNLWRHISAADRSSDMNSANVTTDRLGLCKTWLTFIWFRQYCAVIHMTYLHVVLVTQCIYKYYIKSTAVLLHRIQIFAHKAISTVHMAGTLAISSWFPSGNAFCIVHKKNVSMYVIVCINETWLKLFHHHTGKWNLKLRMLEWCRPMTSCHLFLWRFKFEGWYVYIKRK